MSAFSARLTGSTPVANVPTKYCITSQPVPQPGQTRQTDIVIVVQIDLEHRDFVEVGGRVIVYPFDQVLTASVIDSINHWTRRVQGGESVAKNERSDQECLNGGHRVGAPTRYRGIVVVRDEEQETVQLARTSPQASRGRRRACGRFGWCAVRIPYPALHFRFMLVFGRAFECFALS